MKPLQTLDHVMLWVARVFAALILAYGVADLLYAFTALDSGLSRLLPPGSSAAHFRVLLIRSASQQTLIGAFYLACLFLLNSPVSRLLLGVTAGYFLLRNLVQACHFLSLTQVQVNDWKAVLFIALLGLSPFVDLLFVSLAIRAPAARQHARGLGANNA